jgi:hypothetical protein
MEYARQAYAILRFCEMSAGAKKIGISLIILDHAQIASALLLGLHCGLAL